MINHIQNANIKLIDLQEEKNNKKIMNSLTTMLGLIDKFDTSLYRLRCGVQHPKGITIGNKTESALKKGESKEVLSTYT